MSQDLGFDNLLKALAHPTSSPLPGRKRLSVPKPYELFARPPLHLQASEPVTNAPFAVEVILVAASAAVGKSTMASQLSALSGTPLLNLANVTVAEQALLGMLSGDMTGDGKAEFYQGRLPIIVDALDEGRGDRSRRGRR